LRRHAPAPSETTGDRERWNAKFVAGEAQMSEADPLVVEACAGLPPGRALDLAGGAGRHAIWLAQRGWQVTLADVSDEGLALAGKKAADAGVAVAIRRESLEETVAWALQSAAGGGVGGFDLIVVVWFLARSVFGDLPRMLAPGGLLVYKTYTADHVRFTQGHSLLYALDPGELARAFPSLDTVLSRESNGVAEYVGRAR
jgi:tellurite methyltransferase